MEGSFFTFLSNCDSESFFGRGLRCWQFRVFWGGSSDDVVPSSQLPALACSSSGPKLPLLSRAPLFRAQPIEPDPCSSVRALSPRRTRSLRPTPFGGGLADGRGASSEPESRSCLPSPGRPPQKRRERATNRPTMMEGSSIRRKTLATFCTRAC